MIKGKRSRMTEDRYQKLDELGFKWSTSMPPKGVAGKSKAGKKEDEAAKDASQEDAAAKQGGTGETAGAPPPENGATKDASATAPASAEDGAKPTPSNDDRREAPDIKEEATTSVPSEHMVEI
jgi:hypothetical protein